MKSVCRNLSILIALSSILVTSCGSSGGGSNTSAVDPGGKPVTQLAANGPVSAIVVGKDGTTYIGGSFTQIGPVTGGYVPLDAITGQTVPNFPVVTGSVYTSAPDGKGGWYIGGSFTYVAGSVRNNLAHIRSDGTIDSAWNPGTNNQVNAIVVSGNLVYVGGFFTYVGASPRNALAAIDQTGKVTSWNPNVIGGWVKTLAIDNDVIYFGGTFTGVSTSGAGVTRNRLAAVNASGAMSNWNPNADSDVTTMVINNGVVYVGGTFTKIATSTRNRLAAIDTTGNLTSWDPGTDNSVSALLVNGSTLYAGGNFTKIGYTNTGTITRNHIAAFDLSSALPQLPIAWDPNINGVVSALVTYGNNIYIGGLFSTVSGIGRNNLAAMDDAGNLSAWNPSAGHQVTSLTVSADGATVYAGGIFSVVGGSTRNNLAAIDSAGNLTAWNPSANATVTALAINDNGDTVYAGGNFTGIGNALRNSLAAISATTGAVTDWNPDVSGGSVDALAVSGSMVYAGGDFTAVMGVTREHMAAIDATPGTVGTLSSWNPTIEGGNVSAIAISGNTIFVGGRFTSVLNTSRQYLAAIDVKQINGVTTAVLNNWNPIPNADVTTLSIIDNMVFAGGNFTKIGLDTRNFLAAVDATPDLNGNRVPQLAPWNPSANGGVATMSLAGSTLYIGGGFTQIGNVGRNHLAAVSTYGSLTAWNPDASDTVTTLGVSPNTVYAGGLFRSVGSEPLSRFVGLTR